MDDQELMAMCESCTKQDAKEIEHAVKATVTPIVRKLGGDDKSGGIFLCPATTLPIAQHKIKVRLPIGSQASKMEVEDFAFFLMETYFEGQFYPEEAAKVLRLCLTPSRDSMES